MGVFCDFIYIFLYLGEYFVFVEFLNDFFKNLFNESVIFFVKYEISVSYHCYFNIKSPIHTNKTITFAL